MSDEILDCYSPPGTKVIFAYPTHGWDSDKVKAAKYLVLGQVYTVEHIHIGGSFSEVRLREICERGLTFNTVMFKPLPDKKSAAVATLESLGYTYVDGAEYWKPPLGEAPDFDEDNFDEPTIQLPDGQWVKL